MIKRKTNSDQGMGKVCLIVIISILVGFHTIQFTDTNFYLKKNVHYAGKNVLQVVLSCSVVFNNQI